MRQKRSHLGCLFWVALILLVIVVFLFNRPKIEQVLKITGLTGLVTKQTTKAPPLTVTRLPPVPSGKKTEPAAPTKEGPAASKPRLPSSGAPAVKPAPQQGPASQPPPSSQRNGTRQQQPPPASHQSAPARSTGQKVIKQKFQLYFVKIGSAGATELTPVTATIDFVDSPLTRTFDILLGGATTRDRRDGLRTLIPEGTKLLQASVRDGTAYLDFNDTFRFNAYGLEGYQAQLEQVVFTATQFPTVQRVQILLDGKVRKFLAPEGIAIDKPLDRGSFSG